MQIRKSLRSTAYMLTPPILIEILRSLRKRFGVGRETICFEGNFATWEEANAQCNGYEAEHILAKVLEATLAVKRGEAAFERDSVLFGEVEYVWPLLAGLMLAAARSGGRLNVLDFGGSLGSTYFQNRKFLQMLPVVHWNIVEQIHYVNAGLENIQDERLNFYNTIDDCILEHQPNVVLLSSVLQYLPNPFQILNEILALRADILILDRTSFLASGNNKMIRVQHVAKNIYSASYPCYIFNEKKLIEYILNLNYNLIESYPSLDNFDENTYWRGQIFQRRHDD
jgi:putative methyltransferase (TIGR04325 family)